MTFADLMAVKRVSDPQISPCGKWVMFSVMDVSLEKNTKVNHLWVVPINGSAPEKQVTSNTGESFGRFSPDGKFVSYTGAPTKDDPVSRITIATWDEATGTIGVGRTLTGGERGRGWGDLVAGLAAFFVYYAGLSRMLEQADVGGGRCLRQGEG